MIAKLTGLLALSLALGCSRKTSAPANGSSDAGAATIDAAAKAMRPQLDGRDFPDGVLALTWDDGPDLHTMQLAYSLKEQKIHATFFVVNEWIDGVSDDPGLGAKVHETGYAKLPVLYELAALQHRIGNHTLNHVLLPKVAADVVVRQLQENQRPLDALATNDLRLFRVPGGAWDEATSAAVEGDPELRTLVGPVRWDVDRKDWDSSIACDSTAPAKECEPLPGASPPRTRTKASVVAARYLASIDEAKHGIVLLHDRVGDVGSTYALDLARVLIPALVAKGYVFAAPVLRFSPMQHWPIDGLPATTPSSLAPDASTSVIAGATYERSGDINGDGRRDVCGRVGDSIQCAFGTPRGFTRSTTWLAASDEVRAATNMVLRDVNADGRMDICTTDGSTTSCALAP